MPNLPASNSVTAHQHRVKVFQSRSYEIERLDPFVFDGLPK